MRLLFLGTGTSQGVPMIGCQCAVCRSADPRDCRRRSSLLIQADRHILIDSGPDLRAQALAFNISRVDAVAYTHGHNDHAVGFDDLRRFCEMTGRKMPVYGPAEALAWLQGAFPYAFDPALRVSTYVSAEPHTVSDGEEFAIGGVTLRAISVPHGRAQTFGYIINNTAAYVPDCSALTDSMAAALRGIPLLIIDGLREEPHPTHLHIAAALEAADRVRAGRVYLTHLTHHASHADREKSLPPNARLAYDGLSLEL